MVDFIFTLAPYALFLASFFLNVILLFKFSSLQTKPKLGKNAQALLSEILAGPTVVRIELIEKDSILQWKG